MASDRDGFALNGGISAIASGRDALNGGISAMASDRDGFALNGGISAMASGCDGFALNGRISAMASCCTDTAGLAVWPPWGRRSSATATRVGRRLPVASS